MRAAPLLLDSPVADKASWLARVDRRVGDRDLDGLAGASGKCLGSSRWVGSRMVAATSFMIRLPAKVDDQFPPIGGIVAPSLVASILLHARSQTGFIRRCSVARAFMAEWEGADRAARSFVPGKLVKE